MLPRNLALRIIAPTVFVSIVLLGVCTAAAWYLYHQQVQSSAEVSENVESRRVAHDLVEALTKWITALKTNNTATARQLRGEVANLLTLADKFADKEQETRLVDKVRSCYERFEQDPSKLATLEDEALPTARQLQDFNLGQIETSELAHRQTVPWLAWGLALVGGIGSIAGLVLGYGVAKGLRQSIHQLSVRVRDAAGKLGQDLPTVTLAEDGDLVHLHDQLQGMVHEIEGVVERLQQREREVLRAEQLAAVGQVAAGVAHELRNPLTSIKMLVQTSREEAEARGMSADDLQIIEHEIRRMERCLQTFLDFARPPQPERRPLPLASVVERTLALVNGRARKQGVTIRFTPPAEPLMVEADAEQLQQLLVNLTLNALDAMPRGGALAIDLLIQPGNLVEVRVQDTGPGIASNIAPRLFEPFVSGKETGLGLGLVISRRIAENHGGSLTAANLPQGGACFVLRLPRLRAA